jgi:DNA-binding CsgD family transcriptional regulator
VVWSLARNALLGGELRLCREQLATAWRLSERRDAEAACGTAALESLCFLYSGQLELAEERAAVARDLVRGGTYWRGAANVSVATGFLALARGDIDGVRRIAGQLAETEGGGAHIPVHGQELLLLAGLAAGEVAAVRGSAAALDGLAVHFANQRAAALARYGVAAAAMLADDPEEALSIGSQAMQLQLRAGWRPAAIDSLELIAAAESSRGRTERAAVLGASAAGARLELGLVPVSLPRFQLTAEPRSMPLGLEAAAAYACDGRSADSHARSERLTRSEQAVAELATAGLSNPAIAARLVCSRATVKTHLLHIYAKLGVKNRTELAGRFLSQGSR